MNLGCELCESVYAQMEFQVHHDRHLIEVSEFEEGEVLATCQPWLERSIARKRAQ